MGLGKYYQKRKFNETPEPKGEVESGKGALKFVVQKHHASRLHYDFRLEMDGVLKSWAVPKGPSLNPKDKRLAMMTEDHPMDYMTFEGSIPEGNYGAGDVIVWDIGEYVVEKHKDRIKGEQELLQALQEGKLNFFLKGKKIKGLFSLVKLHGKQENAWLLIKKEDEYVQDVDVTDDIASVLSDAELPDEGEMKTVKRSKDIKKASIPKNIKPMLATLVDQPFDNKDWIFEIKWDGYRAVAEVIKGDVELYSRNGITFNGKYPDVVDALKKLKHDCVLDGEVVILGKDNKSTFQLLQNYQSTGRGDLKYVVFDLLYLDGYDLRQLPLIERKELLKKLVEKEKDIIFSDHIEEKGIKFFEQATKKGLEGVMAKDRNSLYRDNFRSKEWLKIKTHLRQEAVIAGFTEPRGTRKRFGALVLGVYDKGELKYIGHTGTGFNQKVLEEVYSKLKPLVIKPSPFKKVPKTNMPVTWVSPKLVCEIEFTEWTEDDQMRHPAFLGLRTDKPVKDVKREKEAHITEIVGDVQPTQDSEVQLTNLDKIYWLDEGYTKGDLINYYSEMAEYILPYMKDRAQSMHRHPNGIKEKSFFQKDVDFELPDFVETKNIFSESNDEELTWLVCNNKETLLYMANLGCIEMNPWNSRINNLDKPDYVVIDLDPDDNSFDEVIHVAQVTHKILEGLELTSVCKTSGKTGLHIFIPLGGKYTQDQAKQFAEVLARLIYAKTSDITSLERSPSKRRGKIYIDFLQNRMGQTLAAPYSVRPWPGATVSTPLKWSEVKKGLHPSKFTIKNIKKRVEKVGDLWAPILGKPVDLAKAIKKLTK